MTRAVAFLAAALLAATLGAAQDTSASGTASGQNTTSNSTTTSSGQSTTSNSTTTNSTASSHASQNATVDGCLSGSALGDNSFKLTDQDGTVYALTGNTDQLKSHVGHEVSITGQKTSTSDASSTSAKSSDSASEERSSSSSTGNSIQVNSVTMVSDHCKSAGNGPAAKLKGARLIRASMQSAPAADQDASASNPPPAQTGAAAKNKNDLPNTATLLPLLGMLGLGSLVAGFLVRR